MSVKDLRAFVKRNASAKSSKVQDRVGSARIRLAYAAAKAHDFHGARSQLVTASREYKGTGASSADYGSIPEQAAYQAAACLVAEGKKTDAQREFRAFILNRPYSPLVTACYRRLVRLNAGQSIPSDERLLQGAIAKQEAKMRFENSVCGPKTIAYLLPQVRPASKSVTYRDIAKLCSTTDKGTTIAQMRKGLAALGIESYAYSLNREDLAHAPLPAVMLLQNHYVALLRVGAQSAQIFDTRFDSEKEMPLPPVDDPDFTAYLILFSKPTLTSR